MDANLRTKMGYCQSSDGPEDSQKEKVSAHPSNGCYDDVILATLEGKPLRKAGTGGRNGFYIYRCSQTLAAEISAKKCGVVT